jgi:DNA-binding transcriptional regulator YiaG
MTRRRPGPRPKWHISPKKDAIDWDDESIKALREYLQVTQMEMAQELGTRQQTISEWEVGVHKPRGGMARLLTIVAERANFRYKTNSEDVEE